MERRRSSWCGQDCPGRRRCRACRNAYMRARRQRYADLPDETRRRATCRSYTLVYQRRGLWPAGPCDRCGNPNAQNVHRDYSNPRDYVRRCRACRATP